MTLQWRGESTSNSGTVPYHQVYCSVMRLAEGIIVETTAYLDTELVSQLFVESGGRRIA